MDLVTRKFVDNITERLGLKYPVVFQFVRLSWWGDQETIWGEKPHHIVRIKKGLTDEKLYSTIAHELRHCLQEEKGFATYEYDSKGRKYLVWGKIKYRCNGKLWARRDTPWERDAIKFELRWRKFMPVFEQVTPKVRKLSAQ